MARARAGAAIDGWSGGLADYTPARVEKITGVAGEARRAAGARARRAPPAVAIIGGAPLAHTNGLFHALAVNALNALLGSVGSRAASSSRPASQPPALSSAALAARRRSTSAKVAADRRRESGVRRAEGVGGARDAREDSVHRELRQLPRRHERPRGPDSAGPFVPRVVGRQHAGVGRDRGGDDGRRSGDEAAASDARDGRRADRGGGQAEDAGRAAVEDRGRVAKASTGRPPERRQSRRCSCIRQSAISSPNSAIDRECDGTAFRRRRGAYPFHFLPYASQAFATGRSRTCRGCRRCRIR